MVQVMKVCRKRALHYMQVFSALLALRKRKLIARIIELAMLRNTLTRSSSGGSPKMSVCGGSENSPRYGPMASTIGFVYTDVA